MHIGDTFFTSLAGRGACEPAEEKCLALLDSLGIPYEGLTHDPGDTIEICEEIEKKLGGNTCNGRPTSCADQLAKAVRQAYEESKTA